MTVALRGYGKNESIALKWDTSTARTLVTVTADAWGSANAKVYVPSTTRGWHKLVGLGTTRSLASDRIQINASLRLKTTNGPPGTNVQVVIRGFAGGEYVDIQWEDDEGTRSLVTVTSSSTGSIDRTVTVPDDATPGRHSIVAVGYTSGVPASAAFRVT
jgi:hypothetical protein